MQTLRSPEALKKTLSSLKRKNKSIGFVPTMGYLHEGHLSLVRRAKRENSTVVASIFVNPLQFGPKEDYRHYPRSLSRDQALLRSERTDFLFAPSEKTFYAEDFQSSVSVRRLGLPLCGATRPTHFAGVCTVVLKLLNLVAPDVLYLGQKDYQQFRVLQQMAQDLDVPVQVKMCPIVREKDGLAMSSRNVFLSPAERQEAVFLYKALRTAREKVRQGERRASALKRAMQQVLKKARQARLDYLEIVDAKTLLPVVKLNARSRVLAALAVYFGRTRLIDNTLIEV